MLYLQTCDNNFISVSGKCQCRQLVVGMLLVFVYKWRLCFVYKIGEAIFLFFRLIMSNWQILLDALVTAEKLRTISNLERDLPSLFVQLFENNCIK